MEEPFPEEMMSFWRFHMDYTMFTAIHRIKLKGNEMSQSCALIRRNKGHFRVEGKVEGGRDDTDPVLAVLGCV